jgi:hypothetical protein
MRKHLLSLAAALAVAAGISTPARAGTVFSGINCRPQRSDASKVTYSASGTSINQGVYNDSTSSAKVYCPVPYENDRTPFSFFVDVIDQGASRVSCTLYHLQVGGTPIFTQTQKTTGASASPQTLSFDIIDPEQPLLLTCTLPAQATAGKPSRVLEYEIMQF